MKSEAGQQNEVTRSSCVTASTRQGAHPWFDWIGPIEGAGMLVWLLLLISTAWHACHLGDPHYTSSFLIPIEMLCLLATFLLVPFFCFHGVVLFFRRKYRQALLNLALSLVSGVVAVSAMHIDAATLIYMT